MPAVATRHWSKPPKVMMLPVSVTRTVPSGEKGKWADGACETHSRQKESSTETADFAWQRTVAPLPWLWRQPLNSLMCSRSPRTTHSSSTLRAESAPLSLMRPASYASTKQVAQRGPWVTSGPKLYGKPEASCREISVESVLGLPPAPILPEGSSTSAMAAPFWGRGRSNTGGASKAQKARLAQARAPVATKATAAHRERRPARVAEDEARAMIESKSKTKVCLGTARASSTGRP
mmetsp:Transcript_88269/g.224713  ORF Transcript_88269/g.224713 Transcript_88269/m.224713 type:complete len:235 (-) Transcript_88269:2-706(-)